VIAHGLRLRSSWTAVAGYCAVCGYAHSYLFYCALHPLLLRLLFAHLHCPLLVTTITVAFVVGSPHARITRSRLLLHALRLRLVCRYVTTHVTFCGLRTAQLRTLDYCRSADFTVV